MAPAKHTSADTHHCPWPLRDLSSERFICSRDGSRKPAEKLEHEFDPVKLLFLNRFFYPDHSATSQMLSDVAFGLAQRGYTVCVITSRQSYDAPGDTLRTREMINGVTVYRIWTSRFGRLKLFGRTIDYATFYLSAAWRLWRLARSGDVVIAKTDPPMLTIIAAPVCRLRGARLVGWLQDIFPETAEALRIGGRTARLAYAIMRKLRNKSLEAAVMCVVLGEHMAETVLRLGISRVRIIQNWADGTAISPIDHRTTSCGMSGNSPIPLLLAILET